MARWIVLLTGLLFMAPLEARAAQLQLVPASLGSVASLKLDASTNGALKSRQKNPLVEFGLAAAQLVPPILFNAWVVLAQSSIVIGGEVGGPGSKVLGFWAGSAVVSALLSTGWVYLFSRLQDVRPSFLRMLGWSAAFRVSTAAIVSVVYLILEKPPVAAVVTPFALGALGGMISEFVIGGEDDVGAVEMKFVPAPHPLRPMEASVPVTSNARLQVPLMVGRF